MGQALYRAKRPKSLDEVVGQEHITAALSRALQQGHISHAYLLTGPRGVGKTSVARILAHAVNGLPYDDESVHLDIIEIDAASNRRIDEIRQLRDKVHIAPTSAKYKVYIIDEVHMLTREAFNALLKTLEEPPEHVIFILATTEAYKLPATIISRTQRFSFRPIEQSKAVEHLRSIAKAEKININDEALQLIAEHGDGSFRDSISVLDQVRNTATKITAGDVLALLGEAPAEMIDALVQALASSNLSQLVLALQNLREQGFEPARVAKQLAATIRSQLLDGRPPLPAEETLQLLGRLVDVPSSNDQAIALEIALLESAADLPASHKPEPLEVSLPAPKPTDQRPKIARPKADKPPVEPQEVSEEASKIAADAPTKITANSAELDNALWQQAVETIKENHNTLYGIIRMAQPNWEDTTLTLTFAFAFHQKRINDAKNRDIIAKTIQKLSGQEVNVVCVLDPSIKPKSPVQEAVQKPADNPAIESISNIFGGAELLES